MYTKSASLPPLFSTFVYTASYPVLDIIVLGMSGPTSSRHTTSANVVKCHHNNSLLCCAFAIWHFLGLKVVALALNILLPHLPQCLTRCMGSRPPLRIKMRCFGPTQVLVVLSHTAFFTRFALPCEGCDDTEVSHQLCVQASYD